MTISTTPKPNFKVEPTATNQDCFTLFYEKGQINTRQLDIVLGFIESKQTPQSLQCMLKLLFIAISDPNSDLSGEDKVIIENCINTLLMLHLATPN